MQVTSFLAIWGNISLHNKVRKNSLQQAEARWFKKISSLLKFCYWSIRQQTLQANNICIDCIENLRVLRQLGRIREPTAHDQELAWQQCYMHTQSLQKCLKAVTEKSQLHGVKVTSSKPLMQREQISQNMRKLVVLWSWTMKNSRRTKFRIQSHSIKRHSSLFTSKGVKWWWKYTFHYCYDSTMTPRGHVSWQQRRYT